MKKINLFKVVIATILALVLLSWIVPASMYDGTNVIGTKITPIALYDVFVNMFSTFGYFSQIGVFILVVGGFYGVLIATDEYNYLVQKVARIMKGKEKQFIVGTIVFFAVLTSMTSLPLTLFAFIPMFMSVIFLMGYDKLTAIASTVGAISIGVIGSLYSYAVVGNITKTLKLDVTDSIVTKIVLLVFGITLLTLYVIKNMDKVSSKEKEEEYDPMHIETRKLKVNDKPLMVVLAAMLVLYVLGFVYWEEMFKTTFFIDMDKWVKELELFGFPIMQHILGSAGAFGKWAYSDFSIVLMLLTLVTAFIYNIKMNEFLISFTNGLKKLVPTAGLMVIIMSVLVIGNSTSVSGITGTSLAFFDFVEGLTGGLNVVLMAFPAIFAAIATIDSYYFVQFNLPAVASLVANPSTNSVLGLLFQSMYGFTMLFAPTSLVLFAGLSYLNVNYTKWLKYIGFFLLQMMAVIMALLVIVKIIS